MTPRDRKSAALTLFVLGLALLGTPTASGAPPPWVIVADTTLTADYQGPIVIGANGVTLDCAGHSLTGPGFAGVELRQVTGVTVKNCHTSGFALGFYLASAPGNRLENNVANGNDHDGFVLDSSPNNNRNVLVGNVSSHNGGWGFAVYDNSTDTTLRNNTATANSFAGFFVGLGSNRTQVVENLAEGNNGGFDIDSDANLVARNTAKNNTGLGFFVFQASENAFAGNTSEGNQGGFLVAGSDLHKSSHNSFTDNSARNNAQVGFSFGEGASSNTLDCAGQSLTGPGFAGVQLQQVTGVTVKNCHASDLTVGFFLVSAPGNRLQNNVASGNAQEGFALASSPNNNRNVLVGNVSSHNGGWGFAVYDNSTDTTLRNNTATANSFAGFFVGLGSNRTHVVGNVAEDNVASGFDIHSDANLVTANASRHNGGLGFLLASSNHNLLTLNVATENALAGFRSSNSSGNTFSWDLSSRNLNGFVLINSTNETLAHNVALHNEFDGFALIGSSGSQLAENVGDANGEVGFELISGSTGNTLKRNSGHGNVLLDARDENPAGANQWIENRFGSSSLP